MAFQFSFGQRGDDAFRCGWLHDHFGGEADLAERIHGLGATRVFSWPSQCGNEFIFEADPFGRSHQPPHALAGHQHQIVERLVDRVFDPAADRVLIGRVLDGKHRALEHVRALVPQQAGKLGFLAGFQNEDAVSA
ncbi:hypothetical protein BN961_00720 [Afipia felis]|uniref:Uncharacterized protein n=1 Tax=Afipia felis TaxID=1035 RepID=A0A090MIJ6_AFIFE|nr:hypothetical protein BN961_00720 [Afipia felis]